jgi:hypothetical protein
VVPFVEPVSLLVRQYCRGVDVDWKPELSDSTTEQKVFTNPSAIEWPVPKPAPVGALMWVCGFPHLFEDASVNENAPCPASIYFENRVAVVFEQWQEPLGGVLKNRWNGLWVEVFVCLESCKNKTRNYWALFVVRRVDKLVKRLKRQLFVAINHQEPIRVCVVKKSLDHSIA